MLNFEDLSKRLNDNPPDIDLSKLEELSPEQIATAKKYAQQAIAVGQKADPSMNEERVFDLMNEHRVACDLPRATEFKVFDSPMAAVKEVPGLSVNNALFGNLDVSWLYTFAFYCYELGVSEIENKIINLLKLADECGWMWMNSTTNIATRRPAELHLLTKANDVTVLHNPDGMAIRYKDGHGWYSLNGLQLPEEYEWVVKERGNYPASDVMKIENTEVRNEAIKLFDPDQLFNELDPKTLHTDEINNGGKYELYEIFIGEQRRVYLKGWCPSSGKMFNEPVHPDVKTCQEALNWRELGTIGNGTYVPPIERT